MKIAVGPLFACQQSVQLFIDATEDLNEREYATKVLHFLGSFEGSVDDLCEYSYFYANFIYEALLKYPLITSDSYLLWNYGDALDSLKYQLEQTCPKMLHDLVFSGITSDVKRYLKENEKWISKKCILEECFPTAILREDFEMIEILNKFCLEHTF